MNMDFKLWAIPLILQFEIIYALWKSHEAEPFRIYLDDHDSILIPQHHAEVKILNPLTYDDKYFVPLPKINKKPLKYVKHTPVFVKFSPGLELSDDGKKCCGNKWTLGSKEVSLEDLIRPVSLPSYQSPHGHEYQSFEDVKPVTEHIEGDLKYDFRTKTHSLR